MAENIVPVLLSGGAGSRLWPLSRESFPKQFLPLAGDLTMLQETALRVADATRFQPLMVIANADHRFIVAEQLREVGACAPRIILEPVGRNTAAAVATAALLAHDDDPDALILVMPADHVIPDSKGLLGSIGAGLAAARAGELVLFGIRPTAPVTGYGYVRSGALVAGAARRVDAFIEKPDLANAERYLENPDYYWNSGIFLLPTAVVLRELEQYAPEVLAVARAALAASAEDLDFRRLDATAFTACPAISFDRAVLERTSRATVVPAGFAWNDIGAWGALWEIADRDGSQNVEIGDVVAENTTRSYLRSEGPLIATVGVDDLIVVATADAVLVARRDADQDVKTVVERLKTSNHRAGLEARRVHRPWGWYEALHVGERFQVKRLTVSPGGRLSLQKHFHRAEHWVVVNGTAEVHLDGVQHLISENESFYVPLGAQHRLANPGRVPLNLIEVQSGAYLGEDDIVRIEDVYARI
jgi:mannose-1-phosphate guanylyltransferase/mannose-1-phosphate guanylyltransferase/mannose-6-phosphate isomerase